MHRYIIKRLVFLIPVLLGVSFIVFTIMHFTPGDPAQLILGENAPQAAILKLREKMGLNRPFMIQYLLYIWNALKGDFGTSYATGGPVLNEIFSRFPATLVLSIAGMLIAIGVGIPTGIISATKQYSTLDNCSMVFALIGVSMPNFWQGLMLILLFAVKLMWFPSGGFGGFESLNIKLFSYTIKFYYLGLAGLKSLILPGLTLGTSAAAIITRMTRSSMLEVIRQDYIRTARAKGVKESVVVKKHALKNALIPIVTVVGLQFGGLLGGAVLTETVFSWPGVGRLMVDAIRAKDTPVVLASVIFLASIFSVVNLLVDILYAYIDPRIRSQYK